MAGRAKSASKLLRDSVREGISHDAKGRAIDADVIRRLVLSLSLDDGEVCKVTAAGVRIRNATIRGRIQLDDGAGDSGAPVGAIAFENCTLVGGFSGRHGHFSHLSFRACRFRDLSRRAGRTMPVPSIDLTGASLDSDLDLVGAKPDGDKRGEAAADRDYFNDRPERIGDHHFWIRLVGARIDGRLNLSRARLRAPKEPEGRRFEDSGVEALGMSRAQLAGDLLFVGGRTRGRILARGADIKGDVWMTGARLNGNGRQALVLQAASIRGFVVLTAERIEQGKSCRFRRFSARGELNFHGARLGTKLRIGDADLYSSRERLPGTGADPATHPPNPDPDANICLCLEGARVDGPVYITADNDPPSRMHGKLQLDYLEVRNEMHILDVHLGLDPHEPPNSRTVEARLLVAKELFIAGVRPLEWAAHEGPQASPRRRASINLEGARVEFLKIEDCHFSGALEAPLLQCQHNVLVAAQIDGDANFTGADIGGSLDISRLKIKGPGAKLCLNDGTVGRALRLAPRKPAPPGEARGAPAEDGFQLEGEADLRGLTCDTLLDDSGASWGAPARIRMNRFVYRQASWHVEGSRSKPSHRIVGDWMLAKQAEGDWPWAWFARKKRLRRQDYWEPWQIRRNWIYRQFGRPLEKLTPIARHRIDEDEFRPQPLEQAIRAARAEGREAFATHFEMLKQRIEWRHFNLFVRWWLGLVAIVLAAAWLIVDHGSGVGSGVRFWTAAALIVTVVMMVWASRLHRAIEYYVVGLFFRKRPFYRLSSERRILRRRRLRRRLITHGILWGAFFLPAGLLLFVPAMRERPFHYVIAFLIFIVVRWLSLFAHGVIRFGFGYLRRPINAIVTLILAFLIGWTGVHVAKGRDMLVVRAEPVAEIIGSHDPKQPATAPGGEPLLMGSTDLANDRFTREISCAPEISEPLYALDVLIPLVDLREQGRCEVRRMPKGDARPLAPGEMNPGELWARRWEITLGNNRFWWTLEALYAIAGWFIVSLSILTFAQANRAHAEPPTEHR